MKRQPRTDRPDLLPSARDAEEALIGAVLVDPDQVGTCVTLVQPEDFADALWRDAWRVIAQRHQDGEPVDVILVMAGIEASGAVPPDDAGHAASRLTGAIAYAPWGAHAPAYAEAVAKASKRREIIAASAEVAQFAHEEADDVTGLVTFALRRFEAMDARAAYAETGDIRPTLEGLGQHGVAKGLRTGVPGYDEWSPGLRPQEVHTIAGYTGVGKTLLMTQMANSALDQGASVAIFSVEMPLAALVPRMIANRSCAAALKWGQSDATFLTGEPERIRRAVDDLAAYAESGALRVYHEQSSLAQIAAIVREHEPHVVFVDYVQLLDDPAPRMTLYEAATANAKGIQKLAQRSRCTVVMLSQVNEDHQRSAGSSRALGLKLSGDFGAVSDMVLYATMTDEPGVMKLAARKNRHGPDENAGAHGEYRIDKATGKLVPKLAVVPHPNNASFVDRAAGGAE